MQVAKLIGEPSSVEPFPLLRQENSYWTGNLLQLEAATGKRNGFCSYVFIFQKTQKTCFANNFGNLFRDFFFLKTIYFGEKCFHV